MSSPLVHIDISNEEAFPYRIDSFKEIVLKNLQEDSDLKSAIDLILSTLKSKSSKYKYIANATTMTTTDPNQISISNTIGCVWDKETDGIVTIKFEKENNAWIILTIIFVL
ncbi:hypothetical protein DAMA08_006890 [Martiniozyma asiatica (nom. inval.)]|nr:hypothetical protein DAMA08_006890 [Martiniozyma asiatica]